MSWGLSAIILIIFFTLYAVLHSPLAEFGPTYRDYQQRVPRLLPGRFYVPGLQINRQDVKRKT